MGGWQCVNKGPGGERTPIRQQQTSGGLASTYDRGFSLEVDTSLEVHLCASEASHQAMYSRNESCTPSTALLLALCIGWLTR